MSTIENRAKRVDENIEKDSVNRSKRCWFVQLWVTRTIQNITLVWVTVFLMYRRKIFYSKWIRSVNKVNPVSTSSTKDKLWTPNNQFVICSEHFTPVSFTNNPYIVDFMDLTGSRVRLNPDDPSLLLGSWAAIPIIKPAFKKKETQAYCTYEI